MHALKVFFSNIIDFFLPPRSNFEIVKKLSEADLLNLPKADPVEHGDWIHSLFAYRNSKVRAIIWELKYKNNTLPLTVIGRMIFDEILALISDVKTFDGNSEFVLIPIPITNSRRSERGYNQSEYLSRAIIENDTEHLLLYAPQWFRKTKETESQSHSQSREERMKNLENCFDANPEVDGKYVILIDDVVTTGSTLLEARKTLLSSGATDVFAFTIAH